MRCTWVYLRSIQILRTTLVHSYITRYEMIIASFEIWTNFRIRDVDNEYVMFCQRRYFHLSRKKVSIHQFLISAKNTKFQEPKRCSNFSCFWKRVHTKCKHQNHLLKQVLFTTKFNKLKSWNIQKLFTIFLSTRIDLDKNMLFEFKSSQWTFCVNSQDSVIATFQ